MNYIDFRDYYIDGVYEKYAYKLEQKKRLEYDLRVLREEIKLYLNDYYKNIYEYLNKNNLDVFGILDLNEPDQKMIEFKNKLNGDEKIMEFELEYFSIKKELKKIDIFFKNKINYIKSLFDIDLNKFKMHLKVANDYFNDVITIKNLVQFILSDIFKNDKIYYYIEKQGNVDDFLFLIYSNVRVEFKMFYKLILDEVIYKYNKEFNKENEIIELSKQIWRMYNE